eukprot:216777-Prymnesium_polylepis.1
MTTRPSSSAASSRWRPAWRSSPPEGAAAAGRPRAGVAAGASRHGDDGGGGHGRGCADGSAVGKREMKWLKSDAFLPRMCVTALQV